MDITGDLSLIKVSILERERDFECNGNCTHPFSKINDFWRNLDGIVISSIIFKKNSGIMAKGRTGSKRNRLRTHLEMYTQQMKHEKIQLDGEQTPASSDMMIGHNILHTNFLENPQIVTSIVKCYL